MLDLSLIKVKYCDIKLPNGDILNLLKCTQSMLGSVLEMSQKIQGDINNIEKLDEFYKLTTRVINRNKENKPYKQKQIEELLSIDVAMYLVEHYIKWTMEILNDPN